MNIPVPQSVRATADGTAIAIPVAYFFHWLGGNIAFIGSCMSVCYLGMLMTSWLINKGWKRR